VAKSDIEKRLDERLKGWRRLSNGRIAYLPFIGSAVYPMADAVALAIRFEARKTQTDKTPEQLQVALSLSECRQLAEQLLAAAAFLEKGSQPPESGLN
jgi:hypothetical protein